MPDVKIDLPSGPLRAYLTADADADAEEDAEPKPGIVLLHEAFGLNDDIRRQSDRAAAMGYVVVAPDLFEGGSVLCLARAFGDLYRGGGPMVERALEVVDWLSGREDVETGRVGVIGFCFGGGFAFMLGASGKVSAVAPNYGRPPSDEMLARSCPVVASFGGRDRMLRKQPPRVEAALSEAGIPNDVKVYPEAGHSFANQPEGHDLSRRLSGPYLAISYDHDAAEDTWERIEAFFAEHV